MGQQTQEMVEATDSLQTNFDSAQKSEGVLVVPVDWAADDDGGWLGRLLKRGASVPIVGGVASLGETALRYWEDQENAKLAGSALWKLFSGLKKEEQTLSINVMAHSMGNRVLRCMGKSAVEGDASWNEEGLQGKSLLQAAPADLKNQENLFENIFFVSADIPESVFDEPDGTDIEQAEHGLQSGVAALAVMTKRMHVLHADGHDAMLNASFLLNMKNWKGHARLGSRGPWSGGEPALGGKSTKVWGKIGDALEKYEGIETDVNKNNSNVYVQDCSGWNRNIDSNGHSYQCDPKSVAYYLHHMTIDQSMTEGM